jgi:hypothetical protein
VNLFKRVERHAKRMERRRTRDRLAPDGLTAYGWRLVREGGRVKMNNVWFQNDLLLPFVGQKIHVAMNDYWCQEALAYVAIGNMFICRLHA